MQDLSADKAYYWIVEYKLSENKETCRKRKENYLNKIQNLLDLTADAIHHFGEQIVIRRIFLQNGKQIDIWRIRLLWTEPA